MGIQEKGFLVSAKALGLSCVFSREVSVAGLKTEMRFQRHWGQRGDGGQL